MGAMEAGRDRAHEVIAAQARRKAQEERLEESKAHRLPRVSLSEIWMRTDAPAEVFALELNQERFSFQDFVASDPNNPDSLSNALLRLEVELPLYTGGELSTRIRQAELGAVAAEEGLRRTADEAAIAAAEAFLQLTQAREQVALLENSLATIVAHVELARAYVDQGMLVSSELLRAEVERSRVADLLALAKGRAKVAAAALSFRLVRNLDEVWELAPLPAPPPVESSLEHWLQESGGRADLAAARNMEKVAALEVDVSQAARRPRVGVRARYDLADDKFFGSHGDSVAVMAMARLDIFSGGRHRAAKSAAMADAHAISTEVEHFAEAIHLEIRQAHEDSLSARDRLSTAQAALGAALDAERIVGERFRQGVVKMIDLLDAVTARREVEAREVVARTDAHMSILRLTVAAGHTPESAFSSPPPNDVTENIQTAAADKSESAMER
jgi:outer membrane protein TolC